MTSVPAAAIVEGELAAALRQAQHRLRALFEQSPVATLELDADLRVAAWNPAAERLFGYSSEEAIGQRASFLVEPTSRRRMDSLWRELLVNAPSESRQENVTKAGRTLLCEWHNTPLTAANGALLGISSVVLDIAAQERLQEAAVRSYRMEALSKVADGVAHDFTNVFAVILSYANFIKDASPAGDSRHDDALQILAAAGEGSALIRRLLSVSQHLTVKKPVDLNESLAQLQVLLLRSLGDCWELTLTPAPNPLVVRIDPVEFDQVVLNLALNARDAMPNGGKLSITLERRFDPEAAEAQAPVARITIRDNGLAVHSRTQRRLLEPFFNTTNGGDLAGLGLATCLRIVEAAGGALSVQSGEGPGAAFIVDLPIWVEPLAGVDSELELVGRGEQVLVAESDPALRRAATRALEHAGYTVRSASNREDALEQLDELGARLDVIVADAAMRGCSGYELVERALRLAPDAALIMTSAFANDDMQRRPPAGLNTLCKPVLPSELVCAVRQALANRELPNPAQNGHGEPVLVIEDDAGMRAALGRILEHAGYSAQLAATVAEAREQLENRAEPALVLCDLTLADGSSVELLRWIQATRPTLRERVFILTGGVVDEADAQFTKSGAFPLLRKPIEPGPLLRILGRARRSSR